MRNAYTKSLEKLSSDYIDLGNEVKAAINKAMLALEKKDVAMAKEVIDYDKEINEASIQIEKDAVELIALQQPVTKDLRQIVTVLKASNSLERMGDHARTIAHLTVDLNESNNIDSKIEGYLAKMGEKVEDMLTNILQAISTANVDFAEAIAKSDDDVDELNAKVLEKITSRVNNESDEANIYMYYLTISSNLERIGDHISNLAELLIYLETGEMVELNSQYFSKVKA